MSSTDIYFLEKVRAFNALEKEFIRFTYETKKPQTKGESDEFFNKAMKLSFRALELRDEILGEMYDVTDLQIYDAGVKSTIEKLRSEERFESLNFAINLAKFLNVNIENDFDKISTNLRSYFSEQKIEEFCDDFHSWFYIPDYYYGKAQAGAIITSSKLPSNIVQYFEEIKEAYAFGLDRSCISLCRALLEIALYDILKRKGAFRKNQNRKGNNIIDLTEEDALRRFIVVASRKRLITENHKKAANEIRKRGNNVLHVKESSEFSIRGLAIKTIKDTVTIIEHLYN